MSEILALSYETFLHDQNLSNGSLDKFPGGRDE
jgi:hypothetical protein